MHSITVFVLIVTISVAVGQPSECSENEIFVECGTNCEVDCDFITGHPTCKFNDQLCFAMCYCMPGYSRTSNGTCVPFQECRSSNSILSGFSLFGGSS